jgi:hypothetical protein
MTPDKIEEAASYYRSEMKRKSKDKDYKHMSPSVVARSTAYKTCKLYDIDLKFFKKMMI